MLVGEVQKTFIFPRIPLNFELPDNYPDAGIISNISVTPEITNYKYSQEELELEGRYMVAVSFYRAEHETKETPLEFSEPEPDDFFSHLKLENNGLLTDSNREIIGKSGQSPLELYTAHFSRPFHTYIDSEFITRPRSFRPGMVVEKAGLEVDGGRILKGELVLGLINRPRRGFR